MFDFVHKHKFILQIFLGLIGVTFATWGIESYTRFRGATDEVASVNGMKISQREFESELRKQQDRMQQMFGRGIDPAAFDTPDARQALLESMIAKRLVASVTVKENLTVTDDMLFETISAIPAFQKDGRYDPETAKLILRAQNPPMTGEQFAARLRYDMALSQLARAVADSAITPRAVAERLTGLEAQKREIAQAPIGFAQFLSQVKIDDAKLKAHYEANLAEFRTPERVRAEYLVLSADALMKQEQVSAQELKELWDSAYNAKLREKEAARDKARALLLTARKNPEGFAELAKRESQDAGSAASGGDLGFSPRGGLVKPVEEAIFRVKEGEISDVVESQFGFHIIRLTGIKGRGASEERRASHILITAPTDAKPFEEMRGQLEAEVKKQRATRRFTEAAEAFNNLVYEQPDSLKPAAERFKLPLQTTGWVAKSANQELGALDNPKLLAALFSADSLKNRRNTDAVEVAPSTLVAARVIEHQPAAQRGFDEVKGEIAETLRRREAAALAQKDGAAKLEALRKGQDAGVKWGPSRTISRRETGGLPPEVLRLVVSADTAKLPAYVGTPVPDAGYLLVRISKVIEADSKEKSTENAARVGQLFGAAQYQAYVASLRSRAEIEVKKENLEKK